MRALEDLGGRRGGVVLAVAGSLVWLLALAGGSVESSTVWAVVGVGIGVFLVANALRLAGPQGHLSRTVVRRALVVLGLSVIGAVAALVGAGLGPALFVLGGTSGITLWVMSSVAVAVSVPESRGGRG